VAKIELTPEDIKWLALVREREMYNRKHRPLPTALLSRLRLLGVVETRHREVVLTRLGLQLLKEAQSQA
jgi:hypothetical protein